MAQEVPVGMVTFKLDVVQASGGKGEAELDPGLEDVKDALLGTGYKKFKLFSSKKYAKPARRSEIGPEGLPEGYLLTMVTEAKLVNVGGKPKRIAAVRVVITHKNDKKKIILDTTIPLNPSKPVIVMGPELSDSVLMLCFTGA
jgi:hypothetical protein